MHAKQISKFYHFFPFLVLTIPETACICYNFSRCYRGVGKGRVRITTKKVGEGRRGPHPSCHGRPQDTAWGFDFWAIRTTRGSDSPSRPPAPRLSPPPFHWLTSGFYQGCHDQGTFETSGLSQRHQGSQRQRCTRPQISCIRSQEAQDAIVAPRHAWQAV